MTLESKFYQPPYAMKYDNQLEVRSIDRVKQNRIDSSRIVGPEAFIVKYWTMTRLPVTIANLLM